MFGRNIPKKNNGRKTGVKGFVARAASSIGASKSAAVVQQVAANRGNSKTARNTAALKASGGMKKKKGKNIEDMNDAEFEFFTRNMGDDEYQRALDKRGYSAPPQEEYFEEEYGEDW